MTVTGLDRDHMGRYANGNPGNPGGPGNPYVKKLAAIRAATIASISIEDVFEMVFAVTERAKKGDVRAFEVIMNRVLGAPVNLELLNELETIKSQMNISDELDLDTARQQASEEIEALKRAQLNGSGA